MTKVILVLTAVASVLAFGASPVEAAKEKFVRTKPHVNVSGPYPVAIQEAIVVQVGVVAPGELAGSGPPSKPCAGEVDLRIEEAGGSESFASRTGISLGSAGTFEALAHTFVNPVDARVVIVARDMQVDGKECVLRGQINFVDTATSRTTRSVPIRREDFVQLKR